MTEIRSTRTARSRAMWIAGLGACALWLVVQNTALLLAWIWMDPGATRRVAGALLKLAALVAAKLWIVVAATAAVGILFALVLQWRNTAPVREEVRHG